MPSHHTTQAGVEDWRGDQPDQGRGLHNSPRPALRRAGTGIGNLFSPTRRAPEAEQDLPRCAAGHESPSVPIIITIIMIFIQSLMSPSSFQNPFGGSRSPFLIMNDALEQNG